jgi:hypothetical protein
MSRYVTLRCAIWPARCVPTPRRPCVALESLCGAGVESRRRGIYTFPARGRRSFSRNFGVPNAKRQESQKATGARRQALRPPDRTPLRPLNRSSSFHCRPPLRPLFLKAPKMASTSSRQRSRMTNDPLVVRASRRSSQGRRIRDLYEAFMALLDDFSDNVLMQAAVLRIAELRVIGERLRAEMLARETHDSALSEELVRVENMIRRAELELTAAIPEQRDPPLPRYVLKAHRHEQDTDIAKDHQETGSES